MKTVWSACLSVLLLGLLLACADIHGRPVAGHPDSPPVEPPLLEAALRPSQVNPAAAGELAKTISQITGVFVPLAVGIFGSSLPGTAGLDLSSVGLRALRRFLRELLGFDSESTPTNTTRQPAG